MATTLSSTLYPPIIDTFMPAFVCQGDTISREEIITTRVYFSISSYNIENSIKKVHITVNNQNTNITALDKSKYPAGIKVSNLLVDNERETDDKYYVEISNNDLTDKKFNINQFYKVQLRFSKESSDNPLNNQTIQNNLLYFSEWSTGCLIRGISKPVVTLKKLGSGSNQRDTFDSIGSTRIYLNNLSECIGSLAFENEEETEILSSYRIRVFYQDANVLVDAPIEDSGIIYTDSYNSNAINYVFKYNFEDATDYILYFDYQTNNEYSAQIEFNFHILLQTLDDDLAGTPNSEFITNAAAGTILIKLAGQAPEGESPQGTFILRRTSVKSNYTKWDDIQNIATDDLYSCEWIDYTIESGILYKYAIQKINSAGIRGILNILNDEPVGVILDDMFLGTSGKLLKIAFNPQVSTYKKNVAEVKNDTIGSKYPYISKTGAIGYKEFQIAGLISYHSDLYEDFDYNAFSNSLMSHKDNEKFSRSNPNREFIKNDIELYGGGLEDYEKFNQNNNINKYNDFTYERLFREKVLEYLQDTTVKLFRSPSEGNILVKLMNVSLTPQQSLGRLVYDFSATAYEMDECTVENYIKYGIINIETFVYKTDTYQDYIGQYTNSGNIGVEQDVWESFIHKLSWQETESTKKIAQYLKWVHFDFSNMEPEYFLEVDNEAGYEINSNGILGYLIKINRKVIIIPDTKELPSFDLIGVEIKQVSYYHTTGTIYMDYIEYIKNVDVSRTILKDQYNLRVGQMIDTFGYKQSIVSMMQSKYLIDTAYLRQDLVSLNRLRIHAPAGTVTYIKNFNLSNSSLNDQDYYKHIVWDNGFLEFYDDELIIEDFYFSGIKLRPAVDPNNPQPNEWVDMTETKYDFLADIENPENQHVYQLNSFVIGGDGNVATDESGNIVLSNTTEDADGNIVSSSGVMYLAKISNPSITLGDNLGLYGVGGNSQNGVAQANNFYSLILERITPGPTENRYIWIADGNDGHWEEFSENMEIKCPVTAELDYYYEIERKEYSE